jgi:hypothetical protein
MESNQPTRKMPDFEIVAICPENYPKDKLLSAFRAGNIALAEAMIRIRNTPGFTRGAIEQDRDIRNLGESVDSIGHELARHWKDEGETALLS